MYKDPHLPFQNINLSADSTHCKNVSGGQTNKQPSIFGLHYKMASQNITVKCKSNIK